LLGFAGGEKHVRSVFVLLAGIWVIDLAGLAFFQVLLRRLGFPQPRILQDVLVVVAVILWGLVRLHYAGVDLAGIVTTSAVLTGVIRLSPQDTPGTIIRSARL